MKRLIILRGNSGSGKTTVEKIFKENLATIQCIFRRMKLEGICFGLRMV
jgi:predicted ABC-type ATPase